TRPAVSWRRKTSGDGRSPPRAERGTNLHAEPTHELDPRSRTLWRISGALISLLPLAGGVVASWALIARADVVAWVAALPVVAVCGFAFLSVAVVPELRWRRWRYELREEEID